MRTTVAGVWQWDAETSSAAAEERATGQGGCGPLILVHRVVLRWNRAKVIADIDDLAISIWALKVIDEVSQIDDI